MTEFILNKDNLTEQERVVVAMGAIACLIAANDHPELQELSLSQFVPHRYISNLLNMDIEIVRAASKNAEENGYCQYIPEGGN